VHKGLPAKKRFPFFERLPSEVLQHPDDGKRLFHTLYPRVCERLEHFEITFEPTSNLAAMMPFPTANRPATQCPSEVKDILPQQLSYSQL